INICLYNGGVTKSNDLALGSVGSDSAFHFVIVLMCVFVLLDYHQDKINGIQLMIWAALVFMTGPIGFFIYLFKAT
ncbi:hypothetical protein LWH95_20760, partial [Bacillus sp. G16]|nr:hypothetical protein [Bacillus sp. G16]